MGSREMALWTRAFACQFMAQLAVSHRRSELRWIPQPARRLPALASALRWPNARRGRQQSQLSDRLMRGIGGTGRRDTNILLSGHARRCSVEPRGRNRSQGRRDGPIDSVACPVRYRCGELLLLARRQQNRRWAYTNRNRKYRQQRDVAGGLM